MFSPLSDKGGVIALGVDEVSDEGEDGDDKLLVTATIEHITQDKVRCSDRLNNCFCIKL